MPDNEARWRSTGRCLGLRSTAGGGMDADQQRLVLRKRGDGHGGWIGRRLWLAACGWNLVMMRGWSGWKFKGEFGLGEEPEVGGDKRTGGG